MEEEKCHEHEEVRKKKGPKIFSPTEEEVVTYGEQEEEEEPVVMTKCGECDKEIPYSEGHDNGNFFVCNDCG